MRRIPVFLILLMALLGLPSGSLGAQEQDSLRLEIIKESGEAVVRVGDLFSDPSLVDAVLSGFPLRILIRVQLWKDGFFDNQEGQYDWRASVLFDPMTRRYGIQTSQRAGARTEVNTLQEAQSSLDLTLNIPIRPSKEGKYYYVAIVEMETLSLSDLEELQRWLQGELGPVVAGDQDVEGALAKGARRLFVRMLGLPTERFQVTSPSFRVGGQEEPGGPAG